MPTPAPKVDLAQLREEMARKREREHVEAERIKHWDMFRTAVQCLGWCAFGLCFVGWAFHVTDVQLGNQLLWMGIFGGNGGIIFTLLAAYRRGEKRGDW